MRTDKPLYIRNGLKCYTKLKISIGIVKVSKNKRKQKTGEKELRQKLMVRCKGLCENCHKPPDWRGLSKHEIKFRSRGGNCLDPENCIMLCGRCHHEKHHIHESI